MRTRHTLTQTAEMMARTLTPNGRTHASHHKSNYELFNRNDNDLHLESWNYRGCWHQTCPPLGPRRAIYAQLIEITDP